MKYILITGAGNGLGYQTVQLLDKKKYTIFACDLDLTNYNGNDNENIIPINIDVTDQDLIDKAFDIVSKKTDKLDAIINFAGVGMFDSLIEGKISRMQKVMDINLFGTIRMNKTFFPLIRNANGRIINISSENGWTTPSPFNGIYSMSKYAIEAYNHSLRRELNFLGIKVIDIQPGSFKSNMHINVKAYFKELKETSKLYSRELTKMGKMMDSEMENANDFKYLFNAIEDALNNENPKIIYRVKNSRKLSFMSKLPHRTVDNMYIKYLK